MIGNATNKSGHQGGGAAQAETRLNWPELEAALFKETGTGPSPKPLKTNTLGNVVIPLTTGFTHISRSEYRTSPRPKSVPRRLLNTFLSRVKKTGIFSTGRWIDVGGTAEYFNWLGVPSSRRDILNLPGVPTITIEGNFNQPETFRNLGTYDGLLCINCLLMAKDPKEAMETIMGILEPGCPFVVGFNFPHFWYYGPDGEHCMSYNPFNIYDLMQPFSKDYRIFPMGNLIHGFLEYYADRPAAKKLRLSPLLRNLAMIAGKWDREGTTAMKYVAIGVKL